MKITWVTHYLNPRTSLALCGQAIGGISCRKCGVARLWTSNKNEVTCKRCLAQLEKWGYKR
jgi:hypothetical protein